MAADRMKQLDLMKAENTDLRAQIANLEHDLKKHTVPTVEIKDFPVDNKYGWVLTEHGNFEPGEPVVVFRAKDVLLPKVLAYYHLFCVKAGSPRRHLDLIMNSRDRVVSWQEDHDFKVPDSEASRDWMN